MKKSGINWHRVAAILDARDPDQMVRCPYCKAQGVVPYVAEHVLKAHPDSSKGKQIVKVVTGQGEPARSA